ncbi:transposase family protein [Ectothiorhodospiraceae bacterium BW-2]|nr:transposase family protein [Ectothiorhodospiraceae bacterium BW-2]
MKFSTSELNTDRGWAAATGIKKKQFYLILETFEKSHLSIIESKSLKNTIKIGDEFCIKNTEELLFFTLFSLKSGLTYDNLGFVAGISPSYAHKVQAFGLSVLEHALNELECMPIRKFKDPIEFKEFFEKSNIENILIDATEQTKQRPLEYGR